MEIKHIKGRTFCIDIGIMYLLFYKLKDKDIIIVDTGTKHEREELEKLLEENQLNVVGIISTHAHVDHAGNNAYLKKKYNSIIAMPREEARACSSLVNLKLHFNANDMLSVKEYYGHMVFDTDILISPEEDSICLFGVKFGIVPTPGHSIGHISVITPDGVAYLGDCLIGYDVMRGAKMPYAYLLQKDLESKEKLLQVKCSKYVIAHKGIYEDIHQLVLDNIEFYKYRASRIYELIQGAMTLEEMMKIVIERFHIRITNLRKYIVIQRMLRSYLEYLIEIGKVEIIIEESMLKFRKK